MALLCFSVIQVGLSAVVLYVYSIHITTTSNDLDSIFACAGTDAPAIVNCLHILARSLDARLSIFE